MICLKCGADTKSDHIFCQRCLDKMAACPVKPDSHVYLPNRSEPPAPKKNWHKHRKLDAETQLVQLRKHVRRLIFTVLLLAAALGVTIALLITYFPKEEVENIGKNYTYERSTD